MNYIGKFISNFKEFYNEINSATLTGAIDVIVIQQPDGTYLCSPFHVRFGKIGVLRSREKVVDIEINGRPVDIHMKLGDSGEAFFVEEVGDENEIPQLWATSPLPPVPDIGEELRKLKLSNNVTDLDTIDCPVSSELENIPAFDQPLATDEDSAISNAFTNESFIKDSTDLDGNFVSSQKASDEANNNRNNILLNENNTSQDLNLQITNISDSMEGSKMKKKKRKKMSNKKRAKSKEMFSSGTLCSSDARDKTNADENGSTADEESSAKPEEMFQMDDDYAESDEDEGYPCASHGLSRSVSLPLNANKVVSLEWPTRKMSSTFTGEFHPFSDGDVTPTSSPVASRPASPKSDTEYETQRQEALIIDGTEPSWNWGQLPNVPKNLQKSTQDQISTSEMTEDGNKSSANDAGAEKRSMLGGMLSFMRSTKKIRHQPETEGILLQSVESTAIDPEIASLYFPRYGSSGLSKKVDIESMVKDEDAESGTGPSLPQSPHSVEGAIGGPSCSTDSDCEERQYLYGFYTEVAMSMCGGLLDADADLSEERFKNSLITYDKFTENPSILLNPNLVFKLGGKYYNWQTAAPMLTSMILFQRPLPEKTVNDLINEHMPKKKKSKSYSSWWSWRRSENDSKSETSLEISETLCIENSEVKVDESELQEVLCDSESTTPTAESTQTVNSETVDSSPAETALTIDVALDTEECKPKKEDLLETITQVTLTQASSNSSSCSSPVNVNNVTLEFKDEMSIPISPEAEFQNNIKEPNDAQPKKEKYKKSLRLTTEQINSLNLQMGSNEVVFSVTTAYQGTTRCKCDMYLWKYDDKIVISDIDGTITRSDVLGHILPMVGKDWAQLGVAELFTKIHANGYQFLYLSARAIGQARITRDYLRSIRQGQVCLPDGPLLLSPTSLISALHREVIEKKPEEFKISCLKDIQTLFPQYMGNPFYAGFGNKINDTWAYRAVAIPITRIFTINHRGEITQEVVQTFQSSYTKLSDQVDHIFPPQNQSSLINGIPAPSFTSSEEFSYFTYWRQPISTIDEDLLD